MAYMDCRDDPEPTGLRSLFENLLEDDSFPRAGATLTANQVLLTAEADQALAALLTQAEQNGDDDRAVAISQLRAYVGRCRRTGLATVFPPGQPNIDPALVSAVRADMRAADEAEESYDRTGDIDALTAAATAWRQVMTHPSLASAYPGLRAALLNNGGGVLLRRYWAVGSQEDLNSALEVLHISVALTPPHSHLVVGRLCNMGLAIREIYRRSGDDPALERAIGAFEMAAQVAAAEPQSAPTALTNLALGLQDRYLRRGDPDDLERAINCCEQACQDAESVGARVMRGDLLRRRYESAGERSDLTCAVTLLRGALQATPAGSPERPRRLVDLSIALLDQHAESGDPADLSTALQLLSEAVQVIPATSPDRPSCLVHRSLAFYHRYQSAGALDDLERAVGGLDEAVRTTGAGSVDAADWTVNLAAVLHERARRTGEHKENWLRDTAGLAGRAAYASAMAHRLPAAVAAAEAGRADILTETLQRDHLDLRRLVGQRPDLAGRYTRAANRLRTTQQQHPPLRLGL